MGAAASSEAALRAAVATAVNPPAHGKRLPLARGEGLVVVDHL